jgi:hypothetical protein
MSATTPRSKSASAMNGSGSGSKASPAATSPSSDSSKVEKERDTIWKAAERGNTSVVAQFIKKKKSLLNAQNERGHTALHLAALHNCYDVIELLLQEGASLHLKDNSGWSTLHFAASGRNEKLFRLLLEQPDLPSRSYIFFSSQPARPAPLLVHFFASPNVNFVSIALKHTHFRVRLFSDPPEWFQCALLFWASRRHPTGVSGISTVEPLFLADTFF